MIPKTALGKERPVYIPHTYSLGEKTEVDIARAGNNYMNSTHPCSLNKVTAFGTPP